MNARALLTNRWIVVPGVFAIVVGAWNIYVATHNSGLVEGRVVDARGDGAADAKVVLFERGFVTFSPKAETRTNSAGEFAFTGFHNHALQLEAETPKLGHSERRTIRLWFQSQDTSLAEPLRLSGAGS